MRNLIDITDLTIQEIDELIATACDPINTATHAAEKNWLPSFLNPLPEPA